VEVNVVDGLCMIVQCAQHGSRALKIIAALALRLTVIDHLLHVQQFDRCVRRASGNDFAVRAELGATDRVLVRGDEARLIVRIWSFRHRLYNQLYVSVVKRSYSSGANHVEN